MTATGNGSYAMEPEMGQEMDMAYEDMMYYVPPERWEMDVASGLQTFLFPVLMFVGIVGNVLATPTLYVICLKTWSTIFYLSLLGILDLVILLVRCGDTWYSRVTLSSLSERIMNSSDALCKSYMFVFHFLLHLSPWLVVALAVESTIAARWPRRLFVMCTLERAGNVVMLLVIVIVCLDINYFWTWGVPSPAFGCRYTEKFSTEFRDTIWPAMTNIIQYLSPLLLVSLCVFLTATTIVSRGGGRGRFGRFPCCWRRRRQRRRWRRQRGALSARENEEGEDEDEEEEEEEEERKSVERELRKYFLELETLREFQRVSLVLCLAFMGLTLFSIALTLCNFLVSKGYLVMEDDQAYFDYDIAMMLLAAVEMTLQALFYSLKIFLYLGCSATFRTTLRKGFVCFWLQLRRSLAGRERSRTPTAPLPVSNNQNNKQAAEQKQQQYQQQQRQQEQERLASDSKASGDRQSSKPLIQNNASSVYPVDREDEVFSEDEEMNRQSSNSRPQEAASFRDCADIRGHGTDV